MNVTSILGSSSTSSRCAAILQFAQTRLRPVASHIDDIVLRELPGQSLLHARFGDPAIRDAIRQVGAADVVLIATPIHKAAYSGLLKSFLDLLPEDGLRGKTVLPLATGADDTHLLALDYALRPVLSALGARDILDAVYASEAQITSLEFGGYRLGEQPRQRIEQALRGVIDRAARYRNDDEALAARETEALLARVRAALHMVPPARPAREARWAV